MPRTPHRTPRPAWCSAHRLSYREPECPGCVQQDKLRAWSQESREKSPEERAALVAEATRLFGHDGEGS
jgi:hypothetical protein